MKATRRTRCMVTVLAVAAIVVPVLGSAQERQLTLLYPNGGEVFTGDSLVTVRWESAGFGVDERVETEYSLDGGTKWRGIDKAVASAGQLTWSVPNKPSSTVLVRVMSRDGTVVDESDALFEIVPNPLDVTAVLAPNGGEILLSGQTFPIRWQAPLDAVEVTLEYSEDLGFSWSDIGTFSATMGAVEWTVPVVSEPVVSAVIRVSVTEAPDHFDLSDAPFTIRPARDSTITVEYPNGGEVFVVDSTVVITWSAGDVSGDAEIQFSPDAGVSWKKIETIDVQAGSTMWNVPSETTETGRIRVIMSDGAVQDQSDGHFTIVAKNLRPPELIVPNGGEVWTEGESEEILWKAPDDMKTAVLVYSHDGSLWNPIASVDASTGTYVWTVPHIADTVVSTMLVRVVDGDNSSRRAQSAAFFSVRPRIDTVSSVTDRRATRGFFQLQDLRVRVTRDAFDVCWRQAGGRSALIRITDIRGTLVAEHVHRVADGEAQHARVATPDLPAGIYFLHCLAGEKSIIAKTIVE